MAVHTAHNPGRRFADPGTSPDAPVSSDPVGAPDSTLGGGAPVWPVQPGERASPDAEAAQTTTSPGDASQAAGVPSSETITYGGSGLVFVNSYGSGVTTAFRNEIVAAENYLQAHYSSTVTLRCSFDLQQLSPSFSAQNSFNPVVVSYSALRSALQSHATSPDQLAAAAALNSLADPSNGTGFYVPVGAARILGLAGPGSGIDDSVTLNSRYWTAATLQNNPGDAMAVIEHEMTEGAMGRIGGGARDGWAPMDLFRFTAGGQRDFTGGRDGQKTYFSPDGSNVYTGLQYHNPINFFGQDDGFDWADWDAVGDDANATDPFGPGGPGSGDPGRLSITDLRIMNVLGWHRRLGPASDFTGSDSSDILWRNTNSGDVDAWLMNNGQIGASIAIGSGSSAWQFAGAGDFNGDFTSDMLWRTTTTGEVDTWLMNNGHIVGGTAIGFASTVWQILGAGDFNGDSISDVLWLNNNTGEVDAWLMNNGHVAQDVTIGGGSSAWRFAGVGDFNGDGTSDILWQNVNSGEVDTWMINSGHLSGGTAVGIASNVWQPLGTGNFNGDGTSDILWRNSSTGEVDIWKMSSGHVTANNVVGSAPSVWQFAGVGNFDGTGTTDVLWRNTNTGEVDTWQMSGGQLIGSSDLGNVPLTWQIQRVTAA
jgi:FG-GAP-like repeat